MVVVMALLASCWGGDSGSKTDQDPFAPLPEVEQVKSEVLKDRDPRAVDEAIRRIDPCVLLDRVRPRLGAFDRSADLSANSPSSCTGEAPERRVTVEFRAFDAAVRSRGKRTRIGGVLAYIDPLACTAALPVDADRALVSQLAGGSCDARAVARSIVDILDQPGKARGWDAPATWSPCGLLRAALGHIVRRSDPWDPNSCSHGPATYLHFAYESSARKVTSEVHMLGRSVTVSSRAALCSYEWRDPAVLPNVREPNVSIERPNCRAAADLARRTMRAVDSGAPHVGAQRPLFYPADEMKGSVGACFDYTGGQCSPYVDAEVPDDPVELIRHSVADPSIACAVAVDAVREHLGRQLTPIVADRSAQKDSKDKGCVFADPAHSLEIWISASTESVGHVDSAREAKHQVAGHPAFQGLDDYGRSLTVPVADEDEPGQLSASISIYKIDGDRVYEDADLSGHERRAKHLLDAFRDAVADIVDEHL